MAAKKKWGILGTGRIAHTLARAIGQNASSELMAVGSRSLRTAASFAKEFNIPRIYDAYEKLLADPDVEIVYISLPHSEHAAWAIRAAEAGKHILCEKPVSLCHADTMAVIESARINDVFFMEAFMYRAHPHLEAILKLVREKAVGELRVVEASFSFLETFDSEKRLFKNELGGGGILDVGCYPVSMARLLAGAANGKPFLDPVEVSGSAWIGPTGVDHFAAGVLKFGNGVLAEVSAGVELEKENVVRVYGSEGMFCVTNPWLMGQGGNDKIILKKRAESQVREIILNDPTDLYVGEVESVIRHLEKRESPHMSWDDSLGNARALDQWRQAAGIHYHGEKPEGRNKTVSGRDLVFASAKPRNHSPVIAMKYGKIAGVDKKISRLVIGCDNQRVYTHSEVMFDDFFEKGGNCFDSAHQYAAGLPETLLGQWIHRRGIREEVAVIVKGAHTPDCYPYALSHQLVESLERIGLDYADFYVMHRDNPDVPVGEFVDVLNEHLRVGRIKAFGGSNWSLERVDAANAYAQKHRLTGFSVVSNNFSLARMVRPVWPGCVSASDPASRNWFQKNACALFAWSSQARGFFTERAHPDDRSDLELANSWYSPDNFKRRERAFELAKRKKVAPINIALAYVLCQPFETFSLIGPRQLSETRTSLPGLSVELTPEELAWLDLQT